MMEDLNGIVKLEPPRQLLLDQSRTTPMAPLEEVHTRSSYNFDLPILNSIYAHKIKIKDDDLSLMY